MPSPAIIERPLPRNDAAERALLGALLVGSAGSAALLDRLLVKDFADVRNQKIFSAMLALRESSKPVDHLSVLDTLTSTGELEAAGGIEHLASIGEGVAKIANLDHHARSLKTKTARRELIRATDAIRDLAFAAGSEDSLLDGAIEKISEIARGLDEDRETGVSYRDAAAEIIAKLDAPETQRVRTGVAELDALTGGFRPGELVCITAETGTGKTLLAQQTRRRACRDDLHSLYASGEMLACHLVGRELAAEAQVSPGKIRRPERIGESEARALVDAATRECDICRVLDGELTVARIRRTAREMAAKRGIGMAILDYDELIEAPGKDEFDQQRYVVRAAKSLAMELKIPVILISQLRKSLQGEDRANPTLQRLYGSGSKIKHASIVLYVDRPFVRDLCGEETAASIVVLKNRDGKVGRFNCAFNIHTLRFESAGQTVRE